MYSSFRDDGAYAKCFEAILFPMSLERRLENERWKFQRNICANLTNLLTSASETAKCVDNLPDRDSNDSFLGKGKILLSKEDGNIDIVTLKLAKIFSR